LSFHIFIAVIKENGFQKSSSTNRALLKPHHYNCIKGALGQEPFFVFLTVPIYINLVCVKNIFPYPSYGAELIPTEFLPLAKNSAIVS
jgi:hypothetical protein